MQVAPQHALYYPMQANQTLAAAQLSAQLTEASVTAAAWARFSFSSSLDPLLATRGRLRVGILSTQYGANSLGWTLQHAFALQERHAAADSRTDLYALSLTASDGSSTRATLQGLGLSVHLSPRALTRLWVSLARGCAQASVGQEEGGRRKQLLQTLLCARAGLRLMRKSCDCAEARHFLDLSSHSVTEAASEINRVGIHILLDVGASGSAALEPCFQTWGKPAPACCCHAMPFLRLRCCDGRLRACAGGRVSRCQSGDRAR